MIYNKVSKYLINEKIHSASSSLRRMENILNEEEKSER
jgi:hypothetical protein